MAWPSVRHSDSMRRLDRDGPTQGPPDGVPPGGMFLGGEIPAQCCDGKSGAGCGYQAPTMALDTPCRSHCPRRNGRRACPPTDPHELSLPRSTGSGRHAPGQAEGGVASPRDSRRLRKRLTGGASTGLTGAASAIRVSRFRHALSATSYQTPHRGQKMRTSAA